MHANTVRRDSSIDILKGIAVILMIFTHSINFIYSQTQGLARLSQVPGRLFSFTFFLLAYGAGLYLSSGKYSSKEDKKRLFKKGALLLFFWYALNIFTYLLVSENPHFSEITKILLIQKMVGYTEFIIPFIFYTFIYLVFLKYLFKKTMKLNRVLLISMLIFFLGVYVYPLSLQQPLTYYKSILAGNEAWFRFPTLQYFILFYLGLFLGWAIKYKRKKNTIIKLALLSGSTALLGLLISYASNASIYTVFIRWPPSIFFISNSLLFAFFVLLFIIWKKNWIRTLSITIIIERVGSQAFLYYYGHVLYLRLYARFINYKTPSTALSFIFVIIIIYLCWLIKYSYDYIKTCGFNYKKIIRQ